MASEEPQLPPNSPIQVENSDNSTKIWYPANAGSRTTLGMKLVAFIIAGIWAFTTGWILWGIFQAIFTDSDIAAGGSSLLVGFMMVFGVVSGWFVFYMVLLKPVIQIWLEEQVIEVGKNAIKLSKRSPFYQDVKEYPYDDMQGIAFKHPKTGDVSKKYPTIITNSGNKLFFEAATQPEGEWVVQYLKYWLK